MCPTNYLAAAYCPGAGPFPGPSPEQRPADPPASLHFFLYLEPAGLPRFFTPAALGADADLTLRGKGESVVEGIEGSGQGDKGSVCVRVWGVGVC